MIRRRSVEVYAALAALCMLSAMLLILRAISQKHEAPGYAIVIAGVGVFFMIMAGTAAQVRQKGLYKHRSS